MSGILVRMFFSYISYHETKKLKETTKGRKALLWLRPLRLWSVTSGKARARTRDVYSHQGPVPGDLLLPVRSCFLKVLQPSKIAPTLGSRCVKHEPVRDTSDQTIR